MLVWTCGGYATKSSAIAMFCCSINAIADETWLGYVVSPKMISSIASLEAKGIIGNLSKIYHFGLLLYWFIPFLLKNPDTKVRPRVLEYFRELKTRYPNLPVGAAGMFIPRTHSIILQCTD